MTNPNITNHNFSNKPFTTFEDDLYHFDPKNSVFRGANIQRYFDDASLFDRIYSGLFEDLYIGDYFRVYYINRLITFRIAGFNLLTDSTTNNVTFVTDEPLAFTYLISASDTNSFVNSPSLLNLSNTVLYDKFISKNLIYQLTPNSIDVPVLIMSILNEVELLGSYLTGQPKDGFNFILPLFKLAPKYQFTGYPFWLNGVYDIPYIYYYSGEDNSINIKDGRECYSYAQRLF